jgi:glycosyltransferase involved in cell wall biosynthesis
LKRLTVVVPAYNEEANIERVIGELRSVELAPVRLEVVVVNDGSVDGTSKAARRAGAKVINMPFNQGIGVTVQTGFVYAADSDSDFAVQFDGDGQHIASELRSLLQPLIKGEADVVVGSRFMENAAEGVRTSTSWLRYAGIGILSFTIRVLTGRNIRDVTSGFRMYNREATRFLAAHYPDDYPEPESLVTLLVNGFRVKEVPVQMRLRKGGLSSIRGWRIPYYMIKVIIASIVDRFREKR